jgi:DNA-binding transcriptional MerR regulator/effector-binding domain-containing protein
LRYYDQIDLFKPAHLDPETGYRYYSAKQLPRLNRIIALKELGLSLDQIARLLYDNISDDEIRGMLLMKKAELEQSIRADIQRFRSIEARIQHEQPALDVVLKPVVSQQFLAMRTTIPTLMDGLAFVEEIRATVPPQVGRGVVGSFAALLHADVEMVEDFDIEFGFLLNESVDKPVPIPSGHVMAMRELPPVDLMATAVHLHGPNISHISYAAMGQWIESNGYGITGPQREIFLEFPLTGKFEDIVMEIQIPIEKRSSPFDLLPTILD